MFFSETFEFRGKGDAELGLIHEDQRVCWQNRCYSLFGGSQSFELEQGFAIGVEPRSERFVRLAHRRLALQHVLEILNHDAFDLA